MKHDGEICCPDCGSDEAVAKSVAWDALATVPPKTKEELADLRTLRLLADAMLDAAPAAQDSHEPVCCVPVRCLDAIAEILGREWC